MSQTTEKNFKKNGTFVIFHAQTRYHSHSSDVHPRTFLNILNIPA